MNKVQENNKKSNKKFAIGKAIFILSFIIVPTVHFAVFYVYVNLNSFAMAFQMKRGGTIYWTLENFQRFFTELTTVNSEIGQSFVNTFISFVIIQFMFLIGLFVSYFLYKKIFLHNFFRIAFFLPSIIAGTIVNSVFMRIVSVNGPVAQIIQTMVGLEQSPELLADSRFANITVWANMIWLAFPGNMVLLGSAFSRIPESVIESARIDGVNWLQETFRIIIPIVWPTIGLLLMLNIANIFGASGNVFLLTRGSFGTQTLSNWMYMQVYGLVGDPSESNAFNYLSAMGLFLTVIAVSLAISLRKISNKIFGEVQY